MSDLASRLRCELLTDLIFESVHSERHRSLPLSFLTKSL